MTLYNQIGTTYAQTRTGDPRITAKLLEILAPYPITTIADIGAGTGSYAQPLANQGTGLLRVEELNWH